MAKIFGQESEIHFMGPEENWRDDPAVVNEVDPDDDELEETPPDVIALLGFDPKEIADEE